MLICFLALVTCIGTACRVTKNTTEASQTYRLDLTPKYEPTPTVKQDPIFPYRASRTLKNDIIHTALDIRFDWEKRYVIGTATLQCKPFFYPTNKLTLDAKGFEIKDIFLIKTEGKQKLKYQYDNFQIEVALDKVYKRNEPYTVLIEYIAKPYELDNIVGNAAIAENRGLYFINHDGKDTHKPQQIWTQGETQSSSCWFPTIDSPNERMTQEIKLTVQDRFLTVSNGKKIGSVQNNDGTRTDHWLQEQGHAPYLAALTVGEFAEVKDKWRELEVNYYVEKEYEPYARTVFGHTPEMIEFFSQKLGVDFPWDKYSQIVVKEFVSGAMENTGCVIFYDALQHDNAEHLDDPHQDIIAHELFHHWFGDLVTCESWSNLGLNESFASYGEYLWFEHKYGKDYADHHLNADLNMYLTEAVRKQVPIIRYHYRHKDDMFDRHSYQKGARVLHLLRHYVGDEAFFEGLNIYLTKHAYQSVEIHDLRIIFEQLIGEDLNWFFNQWFLSPGHPVLEVSYEITPKAILATVKQTQEEPALSVFRLPMQIQVDDFEGNSSLFVIDLQTKDSTFVIPWERPVANVIMDADKICLGTIFEDKPDEFWLYQMRYGNNYIQKQEAIHQFVGIGSRNIAHTEQADQIIDGLLEALKDPFWAIRKEARNALGSYEGVRKKAILLALIDMAMVDDKSENRREVVELFGDEDIMEYARSKKMQGKIDELLNLAIRDSSYSVQAAALEVLAKYRPDFAIKYAREIKDSRSATLVLTATSILMEANEPSAYLDAYHHLQKMDDRVEKYQLIQIFGEAIPNQKPDMQEKGISLLMNLAETSSESWIRMAAARELLAFVDNAKVKEFALRRFEEEEDEQVKGVFEYMLE